MFKKILSVLALCVGVSLFFTSIPSGLTAAAVPKAGQNTKGRQLFMQYCASCHGTDGKGGGPAATSLKASLPDLTRIAKVDGKFPALRVQRIISGADVIGAHGSREMPVWGEYFRLKHPDRLISVGNVYALTIYIESIQAK